MQRLVTRGRECIGANVALEIALVLGVSLAGLGLVLATRTSFFYADDYLNFGQARQFGLGLPLLEQSVYGEFAPGHRFLDWLVGMRLGLHWAWALVIFMAFWILAIAAFERVASELLSSRRLVVLSTLIFASSPGFVRVFQWWANGEHEVPSIALSLVTLAAALRWLRTRSTAVLALAGGGYLGALLFYTKPVLLPLYVVALAYVVPSRLSVPGISRRRLLDDAPLLGLLAAITLLYAVVVRAGGYLGSPGGASAGTWVHFFALDWFEGVTPWVIGQSSTPIGAGVSPLVDALAEIVLVVVVVGSLIRSRAAWRVWALYLVVWVANSAIVGVGRLSLYGPGMGFDPRYNMELAYLLPLMAALAYSAPTTSAATPSGTLGPVRTGLSGWMRHRLVRLGVALGTVLAAAGFAVSDGVSYARISSSWPAGHAGDWVARVRSSVAALRRRGINPSVIDDRVPQSVYPGNRIVYTLMSSVLPLLGGHIMVDDQSGLYPPGVVASDGTVRLATGRTLAGGSAPSDVRRHVLEAVGGTAAAIHSSGYCVSASHGVGFVQFKPSRPVTARLGVIEIRLQRGFAHGRLFVFVDGGHGYGAVPAKILYLRPGDTVVRAELTSLLVRARLDLQPGSAACFRNVSVVDYRAVG